MRAAPALLAAALLSGCGQGGRVAGNGSETTTGIAARVLDASGDPVAGMLVEARPAGWTEDPADPHDPVRSAYTDGSGEVRFEGLPAGRWVLASGDGNRQGALAADVDALGDGTPRAIVLAAPARVEGRFDTSGGRAGPVAVSGLRAAVRPDASGRFVLDSLPAGDLVVRFSSADGRRGAVRIAARPGVASDAGLLVPAAAGSDGLRSDSTEIRIDLGGERPDTLLGYPVLLRLTDSALDFSRTDGADLLFVRGSRILPHQVVRWDPVARAAEAWVRLDTILPSDRNPSFTLRYGGAGVPDWSSGPSVFDSASGWRGAWHLDAVDPGADAAGRHRLVEWRTLDAAGVAGRGRFCDTGWLRGPDAADLHLQTLTASAWALRKGPQIATGKIFSKGNRDDWRNTWSLQFFDDSRRPAFLSAIGPSAGDTLRAADPMRDGIWTHLAFVRDAASGRQILYVDGVPADSSSIRSPLDYGTIQPVDMPLFVGANFIGVLDEVRLSATARSPSWIALDQALQRPGSRAIHYRRAP